METYLPNLFNHSEEGEAWIGMAHHISAMDQLDRIIFEDCDLVDGKVVAPHENTKVWPSWLTPGYVAKKANVGIQDAKTLLDCWLMLDPTKEMVDTFCGWVSLRGAERAIPYFEKIALALAEVENIDPEDALEQDDYESPMETAEIYAYHPIGEYPEDDETPWIQTQPQWFQALIAKVRSSKSLSELKALGKKTYSLPLSKDQSGVFWTEYQLKKRDLEEKIKPGPTAKALIQRITKANGNLRFLGHWLYKVQKGQVHVNNPPTPDEWEIIWKTYQQCSKSHAVA